MSREVPVLLKFSAAEWEEYDKQLKVLSVTEGASFECNNFLSQYAEELGTKTAVDILKWCKFNDYKFSFEKGYPVIVSSKVPVYIATFIERMRKGVTKVDFIGKVLLAIDNIEEAPIVSEISSVMAERLTSQADLILLLPKLFKGYSLRNQEIGYFLTGPSFKVYIPYIHLEKSAMRWVRFNLMLYTNTFGNFETEYKRIKSMIAPSLEHPLEYILDFKSFDFSLETTKEQLKTYILSNLKE